MRVEHPAWYRVCQVCGQHNDAVIYHNKLADIDGHDMSYDIAACEACGFHYAVKLPTPAEYQRYYQALSKYDVILPASAVPAVDKYRAEQAVEFVSEFLEREANIWDLGCGSGTLLNAFAEAGWIHLGGLDPAPNAPRQAKTIYGLDNVHSGTLEQTAALTQLNEPDLICLMGVLEHLPELRQDMEQVTAQLGKQTKILVEVPASERFMVDDYEPYGEFSLEHIQFFSRSSLNRLMASLGWQPLKTTILDLPRGTTDSLLCLYGRGEGITEQNDTASTSLQAYITASASRLAPALEAIKESSGSLIIFGAGSHTARLLPYLQQHNCLGRVRGIVDNNANLQGKTMADWQIQAPEELLTVYPDATVLISSYRSQQAIAQSLKNLYANPILTIYSPYDTETYSV